MRMDDVSDEELNSSVRGGRSNVGNSNGMSDEELIRLTKNTMSEPPQDRGYVEKELPIVNNNFVGGLDSSNYWKIEGLPSKGKFYPEGTLIVGRPLKVIEVKKITSINDTNADFILNDILSRCIKGIDVNKIFIADKLFFLFWLRANSFRDSSYVVSFKCCKCEKESDYHFEIDSLETQVISDEYDVNKEFTVGKDKITYEYLKVEDELYIYKFKEINSKIVADVDDELLAMAHMIKKINGKSLGLMEKYFWMTNIAPGEFSYLKTIMNKFGMGVKPFVNVTCKFCGGITPVGISFREDFFLPEYKID